eukprot:1175345-Prorocentrum_minimum.AAC.1
METYPARARSSVLWVTPLYWAGGSGLWGPELANQSQETREHIPGAGANGARGGPPHLPRPGGGCPWRLPYLWIGRYFRVADWQPVAQSATDLCSLYAAPPAHWSHGYCIALRIEMVEELERVMRERFLAGRSDDL